MPRVIDVISKTKVETFEIVQGLQLEGEPTINVQTVGVKCEMSFNYNLKHSGDQIDK